MATTFLTTQAATALLASGLLGAASFAVFRVAATVIDPAALRARDARRIRSGHRAGPVVLAVSLAMIVIGAAILTVP